MMLIVDNVRACWGPRDAQFELLVLGGHQGGLLCMG